VVDVLAADPSGREPAEVVASAPVVALPRQAAEEPQSLSGGLVVLALPRETALALAGRAVTHVLSVVLSEHHPK